MNPTAQIKIPDGTILDLKDAGARQSISDLNVRVTALENKKYGTNVKFFHGSAHMINLLELSRDILYPNIYYIVDQNNNAIGRFLSLFTEYLNYTDLKNTTADIVSGAGTINLGNVTTSSYGPASNFSDKYPNIINQFDSLATYNNIGLYRVRRECNVSDVTLNHTLKPCVSPSLGSLHLFYVNPSAAQNDVNVQIQYTTKYFDNGYLFYEEISDEDQIYVTRLDAGFQGCSIHAEKASTILKIELYNESNQEFENVTLYNTADAQPIDDTYDFYLNADQSAPMSKYIYKITFGNATSSFWTLCNSRYKYHA